METNVEKPRRGHIHNQTYKHLERVRETGWEQLLQTNARTTLLPSLTALLVASPTGDRDPEETGDLGKGRG